jgi:hypothetical protein
MQTLMSGMYGFTMPPTAPSMKTVDDKEFDEVMKDTQWAFLDGCLDEAGQRALLAFRDLL